MTKPKWTEGYHRMMLSRHQLLKSLYDSFNARDIEAALAAMHPEVVWANGLEGGHVYGRDGVRKYWTEQWKKMDSRAEPLEFHEGADGAMNVEVRLTASDSEGGVLFDKKGRHVFHFSADLIGRFDIG